jgi:OmpA-OmpF porin, OOP family
MNKFVLSTVAAASLLVGTAALAGGMESSPVSNDAGFYVGAMGGWGETDAQVVTSQSTDNDGFSWGVDLGYQFTRNLAAEIGFTDFPNVKGKNPNMTAATANHSFDIAVKGILPLADNFNVFGKVGLALVHTKVAAGFINAGSTTRAAALLGAGVGYNIGHGVSVNVQTQITSKNDPVPAMYGVYAGLSYKIPAM